MYGLFTQIWLISAGHVRKCRPYIDPWSVSVKHLNKLENKSPKYNSPNQEPWRKPKLLRKKQGRKAYHLNKYVQLSPSLGSNTQSFFFSGDIPRHLNTIKYLLRWLNRQTSPEKFFFWGSNHLLTRSLDVMYSDMVVLGKVLRYPWYLVTGL